MDEIDIKELLSFIKEKIIFVGIALVISLLITLVYIGLIKKPIYKSSTTYVLISDQANGGITTSEVTLNEKLIATYKEIIRSSNILDKVIANLNLKDETQGSLSSKISVEQVSTSSMIRITVSYDDALLAQRITECISSEFVAEIQRLYNMNNISVVDSPKLPTVPSNVSNLKEIIIINGSGVVLSLFVIFLIFYFDNTIKSAAQVSEKVNLPILGNIPMVQSKKVNQDLIVHTDPKSPISEGIRTIRTNLQFANVDGNLKKIMVTSSMPSEGKSFTSTNIAIAFAQNGYKVLIVDCDMRKGRIHKIFKVSNEKGLSNLLIDNVSKSYEKYIRNTHIKNLDVLPAGIVPPNPSELLNSLKNRQLVEILEKEYDYIIFDCVPINGLPDSLIMTELVDKVMIVCASKMTPIDILQKTKQSLQAVDADIAGVIINKSKGDYNKYYGHYYG
ncbi:MAG: polysaccharide biosynthesis tyrosine autokinase [Bacilli bacterium]|nr:polysaccharide biosynthesis tyrosine autokinase [Bacilli bacterium]